MNENYLLNQIDQEEKIENTESGLPVCDFCFRSEIDNLIKQQGEKLLKIVKTIDGLWICDECLSQVDLRLEE